jgi:hypothetical protein
MPDVRRQGEIVMAFKRSGLMLFVSLAAIFAIAQDAADNIGSWAIRIASTDGWGQNETFWVNSEGETGYADLSARILRVPCSGKADAAVINRIEGNLIELISEGLSEEPRTDEPRLRCEDGPSYHVLIRFGQEGEFEFL